MTQDAVVTRIIDGQTAEVTVRRGTACGGNCASCGGTCTFKSQIVTRAGNSVCASVGDRVIVESRTSKIIGAAALVYILPLVMLFTGYAVSALFSMGEGASVAVSLAFFIIGVLAAVISQRLKGGGKPVTCEIIGIR